VALVPLNPPFPKLLCLPPSLPLEALRFHHAESSCDSYATVACWSLLARLRSSCEVLMDLCLLFARVGTGNYRPDLSSERESHMNCLKTIKERGREIGRGSQMGARQQGRLVSVGRNTTFTGIHVLMSKATIRRNGHMYCNGEANGAFGYFQQVQRAVLHRQQ
jgi:hypothetical protein